MTTITIKCSSCGAQVKMLGTTTSCPSCGQLVSRVFDNPEMDELNAELAIGLEGLKGLKANRNKAARDAWDLEKEKLLFHEQHGTKECGKCGTINFERAKFCMECAKPFESSAAQTPPEFAPTHVVIVQNTEDVRKNCNQCGMLMKIGAAFCPNCGHKQKQQPA